MKIKVVLLCAVASVLIAYITPIKLDDPRATQTVTVIGDAVVIGFPDWVFVCQDANVYGNPYGLNEPLDIVKAGSRVRVHDVSQDNTWIMIKSAHWIDADALCWDE